MNLILKDGTSFEVYDIARTKINQEYPSYYIRIACENREDIQNFYNSVLNAATLDNLSEVTIKNFNNGQETTMNFTKLNGVDLSINDMWAAIELDLN